MDDADLNATFLPHLVDKMADISNGKRLVHYTSAESAYKILASGEVWLRNAHLMNDYSELRHGLTCLQAAWSSPSGEDFQKWLNGHWPGLKDELQNNFDTRSDLMLNLTHMISLSEHEDSEDNYGRLSMWRAYGKRRGVAIVMNPQIFMSEADAIKVYSAPVSYLDISDFVRFFSQWFEGLQNRTDDISKFDRPHVLNLLFHTFRTFVLCTKHPGFHEEREWRVFHTVDLDGSSPWIHQKMEIIDGSPQHVITVDLKDDEVAGVIGLEPNKLVNRIIIGPCESPLPIRNALANLMTNVGIEDSPSKVWMSFIPLRDRS